MSVERPTDAGVPQAGKLAEACLADVEAVRLLLSGGSVVDWHRLAFRNEADVDRFLRVNEVDPASERDVERLERVRADAVEYLTRTFGFRIPPDIADELPARDLLLVASGNGRRQVYACIVLKVMHIIHHLAGRELLFRAPVSDDEVFHLVERKVVRIVDEMRAAGHPIIEFVWSRKPHDSLITKLLAKRSTLAANVYDKLRFRMVVREEDDILPLLVELTHRLIPFNYVIPGESVNQIVQLPQEIESAPALAVLAPQLQQDIGLEQREVSPDDRRSNEFSSPGYRIINFVADMPVRLDEFLCRVADPANLELGAVAFVLTEFQVADTRTAHDNETGENSHEKYKERQLAQVKARLLRGLPPASQADQPLSGTAPGLANPANGRRNRNGNHRES